MYHLVTTVIMVITGLGAAVLFEAHTLSDALWVGGTAVLSLLIHWLATKDEPKGIPKKDAFK